MSWDYHEPLAVIVPAIPGTINKEVFMPEECKDCLGIDCLGCESYVEADLAAIFWTMVLEGSKEFSGPEACRIPWYLLTNTLHWSARTWAPIPRPPK